jgi:hypothetical protein
MLALTNYVAGELFIHKSSSQLSMCVAPPGQIRLMRLHA